MQNYHKKWYEEGLYTDEEYKTKATFIVGSAKSVTTRTEISTTNGDYKDADEYGVFPHGEKRQRRRVRRDTEYASEQCPSLSQFPYLRAAACCSVRRGISKEISFLWTAPIRARF